MPFTLTLDPVLLHLGPISIRYYGIAYALGFLFAWWWLKRAIKIGTLKLTDKQVEDLIFWLMIGVVAGARLGHVLFWNFPYFLANPLKIFAVWEGGMAFHGGLIGALLAGWRYCRKQKLNFLRLADVLIIPATFALALGRVANFINGELYGPITNVPWCVNFPGVEGCRHPYQLYAAFARAAIGCLLILFSQRKHRDGTILWLFLLLESITRFSLDFLREDARWFSLSTGQYLSIAVFAFAIWQL